MEKPNKDIHELIERYGIKYSEIREHLPKRKGKGVFAHTQRIFEELSAPLTQERKKTYLLTIEKIKELKRKIYEE